MAPEPCLAVPCPLCRASAGEPCHELTRERAERRPHNRRRWAFREIFGRWPEDEIDEEIRHGGREMNNTLTPPHEAPAGYIWRKAHGGGVYLVHESAEISAEAKIGAWTVIGEGARIGEGAWIGERGDGYMHATLLGHDADAYRTADGTLWLRYGCETHPVSEWRERVADLCRLHVPSRAQEYERAIRALLDTVEAVIGATEIRAAHPSDRSESDGE